MEEDILLEESASPAPEESASPEPEESASPESEEASPEPMEVIDYERLTISIQEAVTPAPDVAANINDLPLSDVIMLLVALVLGILVVKGRST